LTLLLFLSIFLSIPVAISPELVKNPDHMIVATTTEPETVDPAWCYDTVSGELIFNVYDTLIRYDRESVDEFVPCLATNWVMSEDGLTFWFNVREGVRFHNGDVLTTEDVEYSFKRCMVQDSNGGPTWMILERLFGVYSIDELGDINTPAGRAVIATKIDNSVECNATHVWFSLMVTSAPSILYQILAQPFASILNKQWCIDRGDWPGTWNNWINYYDPEVSPLDYPHPVMMGTGPYKFDYWEKGVEWSIVKNDGYWQGWPAPRCGGYVKRVTEKLILEWVTRKMMFLAGDCDICYVPRAYTGELLGLPGIRSIYPLPSLSVQSLFFQFDINPTTPYDSILPHGTFDETGIPSDFFGNSDWGVHVRKAFTYCIDFDTFIAEALGGEAIVPATAIIPGLFGYDPTIEGYSYNLANAEAHFKSVPGLWETGFSITIPYYTGSYYRQTIAEMLKASIEALNMRFHVTTLSIDWTSYLWAMSRGQLPCFMTGWIADYPDAHNLVVPFYASDGYFAYLQGYSNPVMDALIEEGIRESDSDEREAIYREIALLAIEDCPSVPLDQPMGRHFERDWVQGWYYNPMYLGNYYYHLWKGEVSSAREDQILIEEVIDPPNLTTDLIAFRWPEPLMVGDVITPCIHESGEYLVNSSKWFYWIDDCPYAMFAHDTRYVFIDDETGEYEVLVEKWPPSLNGQEMWSTPEEFWDPNNWVYSTHTNSSEHSISYGTTGLNSLIESKPISAINPGPQSRNRALIIEGHIEDGSGQNASELWYNMLLNFGYTGQQITYLAWEKRPLVNDTCTRENVFNAITNLSKTLTYGDTLIVYIYAHGYLTNKSTPSESGYIKLTKTGNNKLYDWELNQSLSQIPAGVHINIVMDVCHGGSFMDDLWMLENVDIIISATDWQSETYFAWLDPPENYRYVAGLIDDPNIKDEGGEFSSGLVEALDELAQQYQEVGLLYLKAFNRSKEKDAGYINREKLATHYKNWEKAPYPLLKMVYYLCDVNHDGRVSIMDLALVASHYGASPGSTRWNPEFNINRDRVINILDLTKIAKEFGKVYFY
jgi:peptide/nickel transport system substrate-binding protein